MAVTYNNTKIGRAGGPNPALIKEYTTVSTVCKGDPGDNSVVLIDASAQPGGSSSSYYLIWGVTAVTDSAAPFFGLLYDSLTSHSANTVDAATYIGFGANVQGPFFWNTEHPLKIKDKSGLKIDLVAGTSKYNLTVAYSLIHP